MKKIIFLFLFCVLTITVWAQDEQVNDQLPVGDFKVLIDYNQTVEQILSLGKKYDHVDYYINSDHFPPSKLGKQDVTMQLFDWKYYSDSLTSEQVIKLMGDNYRPANCQELLMFGFFYPKLQEQYLIIALQPDSRRLEGSPFAIVLDHSGPERKVHLSWFSTIWNGKHCLFLAVKK